MNISCADAITLVTGVLTVPVERLYSLCNEITGDDLYTHQLALAIEAAQPRAEAAFPELKAFCDRNPINRENWVTVVDQAKSIFGDLFEITPLDHWVPQDPWMGLEPRMRDQRTK